MKYQERVLEDNYPVYYYYYYVCDDEVVVSRIEGTIADLKRVTGTKEIKSCDSVGRGLFLG